MESQTKKSVCLYLIVIIEKQTFELFGPVYIKINTGLHNQFNVFWTILIVLSVHFFLSIFCQNLQKLRKNYTNQKCQFSIIEDLHLKRPLLYPTHIFTFCLMSRAVFDMFKSDLSKRDVYSMSEKALYFPGNKVDVFQRIFNNAKFSSNQAKTILMQQKVVLLLTQNFRKSIR